MTGELIWIHRETGFALETLFRTDQIKKTFLTIGDSAGATHSRLLVHSLVIVAAKIEETGRFEALRTN